MTIAPARSFLVLAFVIAGCGFGEPANGPYTTVIAPGLQPRLAASDAIAITRQYLAEQTPQIAAPELHVVPHVTAAWAIAASAARSIDGCIPIESSTQIVWVTKGVGDYLNLRDLPWSRPPTQADANSPTALICGSPAPAGTIVIDDTTGTILGVFPEAGLYSHPTGG